MPKGPRTADVARRIVDAYVTSLRQHLPTYCIRQFDKLPGANEHQLTRLRQSYPGTPKELVYFLQRVNGTCWESLVAPPGSVPPPAPTPAAANAAPAASNSINNTTAAAAVAAASMNDASTQKANAKATAAAASIASEAAAFIKSQIAKKVSGSGALRPRRVPHYVALPILGSTYTTCPYYLKSVEQMLLAEQQFPPPSANLPDEGDSWAPPPQASSSSSSSSAAPAPTDGHAATSQGSSVADAAAGVQLNKNTIASVFADHKIIYGTAPAATAPTAASLGIASSPSSAAAAASGAGEGKVVYVDPRIDIHANFYHWLVFADSVQPHVRERVPTIPDADPAKVAAAAVAGTTGTPTPLASDFKGNTLMANATAATAAPVKVFAPSRLYIDFKPVELQGGEQGQVIQFVHGQPSTFTVVASDFGSYLKYIMSEEYEFTEELEDDEDDEEDEDEDLIVANSSSSTGEKKASPSASAGGSSSATPQ